MRVRRDADRDLHGFRLVKGRLFCLRGPSELIALDGDTGDVDWSFSAPQGRSTPTSGSGRSRRRSRSIAPTSCWSCGPTMASPSRGPPWPRASQLERPPLPVDDDSVLLVLDPRTVKKFDLNHGQIVWVYRESEVLPVNGPPRLLGDAERVLVLHEGRTLIRLDPATGSKRWSCPLGTEDLSDRPGTMALDERRFYCISRFTVDRDLAGHLARRRPAAWIEEWAGRQSSDTTWSIALARRARDRLSDHTGLRDGVEMDVRSRSSSAARDRRAGAAARVSGRRQARRPSRPRGRGPIAEAAAVTFNVDHAGPWWRRPGACGDWAAGGRRPDAALDREASR